MSETPRTDDEYRRQNEQHERMRECGEQAFGADFDFARTLERELAAMTAERDALDRLVLAFKQKREVDGMNGRTWDSTEHLLHEREVARLLGEPEWKRKAVV